MLGLPLAFTSPFVLAALALLPVIWWLLRLTPPRPQREVFPPFRILARLISREETPAQSPWWLTLLRLAIAFLVILAMSGPIWNPDETRLRGEGPVLIALDNGWASGRDWADRRQVAIALAEEAAAASRPVVLLPTADIDADTLEVVDASSAIARLESLENLPQRPDHTAAALAARQIGSEFGTGSVFLLSDGLARDGSTAFLQALAGIGEQWSVQLPADGDVVAIDTVRNDPDAMVGTVIRPDSAGADVMQITAYDIDGLPLARQQLRLAGAESRSEFRLTEPVELRNQIVRVSIDDAANPGAVQLLDESHRRRLVGLISGEASDLSQPLLSPLYYIAKALAPFSDIRRSDEANVASVIPTLVGQGVSAIVMADIGNIPDSAAETLTEWVEKGGMLIRFAGPRLAGSQDDRLLPIKLRRGDRSLGGALSWETPKPVAPFESRSPFFGLEPPREVVVTRQVLALQDIDLESKTWAVLDDGTPLVTADRRGAGWIVLFHVSSDAGWSNLPISGTFVDMLRRVVNQSSASGAGGRVTETVRLPPLTLLNGRGEMAPPPPDVQPLVIEEGREPTVTLENPPGFYGTEDGFVAVNLMNGGETLQRLDPSLYAGADVATGYGREQALDLLPWLLMLAAALLVLDCIAVLILSGAMRLPQRRAATAMILAAALAFSLVPHPASAQDENGGADIDYSAALATRFAYVLTGVEAVDDISRAGLSGLTQFVAARTALEPAEPIGVDLASDELSFYPLIYWPISVDADLPDPATMARVDAFMRQGGTILFDTRDQFDGTLGGTSGSAEARVLQAILSGLDVPPLEPVPPDHVLTKAFYLLNQFPGRYFGGDLWVEAIGAEGADPNRPARAGDGVSSIMITSNDMAGAWAVDSSLRPMFPTVPPDPLQREMSYRAGVNLVMYAMTGNYKADQVHVPALLERLGQ
jgi:Domain of unknown function (DUF4159)/Aerotolerance regulator N-terminal